MPQIEKIIEWFKERGNDVHINDANFFQEIKSPRAIEECTDSSISFIANKYSGKLKETLDSTKCNCIIVDKEIAQETDLSNYPEKAFIISENAKNDLIAFCSFFLGFAAKNQQTEIHPSAVIEENASIGKYAKIGANVVIEAKVIIGDYCTIDANSILKSGTEIGDNVEIGSNNVIGGVGFGYSQNESGEYYQFPHYGKVILKDNVHIGNSTCIDRGSLSDTTLHEGVKVDNLVHIAHNVQIGKNSLIIAHAMIAGSVIIGENCWIAPSSCIRNAVKIGDNVTVGLASTVTKNVASNSTVIGSPAMPLDDFNTLRRLQKKSLED